MQSAKTEALGPAGASKPLAEEPSRLRLMPPPSILVFPSIAKTFCDWIFMDPLSPRPESMLLLQLPQCYETSDSTRAAKQAKVEDAKNTTLLKGLFISIIYASHPWLAYIDACNRFWPCQDLQWEYQ